MADFRTSRMILKSYPGEDAVAGVAASKGWARVNRRSPGFGGLDEAVWKAGPGAELCYQEDDTSPTCWVTVRSDDAEPISAIASEVYTALSPWSLQDLAAEVDYASDLFRLGQALIRLGIAAPYEYDQAVFERITIGLMQDEQVVRNMAIWATTYSPYAEYRPKLSEIARHDPVRALRKRARITLAAFDHARIG